MDPRVERVQHFLKANSSRRITAEEVSGLASLSPSHLRHLFKSETGLSMRAYLREIRLQRAVQLLRESEMRVSEVVFAVGYENVPAFNRRFKRKFGMSPREYRRRNVLN